MSIKYLTVVALLGLAAGAFAEVRWGQVELAFFRVRGENGQMVDLPTKGIVLPVRMERIHASPNGKSVRKSGAGGGTVFPTAQTIYQNDLGTNYFYDPDGPSSLDDINIIPNGNGQWWHELTLGAATENGNSVKIMNRQLGWTTYVQGRGPGVQAFDNLVTDVGWVFQPGQFPPGAWKYTIPIYQYWALIPDWNKPRVPSGLLYFAQEWRAYDINGNGAFLTSQFSPVFSGDGDPQIGFSLDNFWPDWDPVPDGIFSEDEFDYFGGPPNQANFLMTVTSQSVGVTEPVRPTSVSLSRGTYISGNVGSFHFVNQVYYQANKGLVMNQTEAPIQIILEGFSPASNLTAMSLDVVSMVTTSGLQQKLELFNYQSSQWVQVDVRAAPVSDTRITVGAPGTPTDYVDVANGNVVKMRISYKQTGPTAILNWGCKIDLANWLVTHP
jgi:hypothetical protein